MSGLRAAVYSSPAVADILSPTSHVARLLEVEAALARALVLAELMPADAAERITAVCAAEAPDSDHLERDTATAGTPVIPLVRWLRAQVGETHAPFVHLGVTSQDIVDTAMVLQLRAGIDVLVTDLWAAAERCHELATEHRATPMAGRTLGQQAVPITFGLKAARWLDALVRSIERLRRDHADELVLQLGGAAGTLAPYGERGPEVAQAIGAELNLAVPPVPWHGERDRVGAVAGALAVTAGTAGSIARDLVLLSQTEVGEAHTASPGGSSAMPHKRNPVDATFAIAAARLASGAATTVATTAIGDHERDPGGWQAEWIALPDVLSHTAGATHRLASALRDLRIDPDRMRSNLDARGGLVMAESLTTALATRLGQLRAGAIVGELSDEVVGSSRSLRAVAAGDARVINELGNGGIDAALDPADALGAAGHFIDAVGDHYRAVREQDR